MSLYVFGWERSHQSSTYATGGEMGSHPKYAQLYTGEGGCHVSCMRTQLHYFFHVFWQHFCLIVSSSVLFVEIFNFIFTQKNTFIRNGYYYIKILFWRKINNATFYSLIFLVKIWSENSISIPIHPRIIHSWIWLLGGAVYQRGEEAEV